MLEQRRRNRRQRNAIGVIAMATATHATQHNKHDDQHSDHRQRDLDPALRILAVNLAGDGVNDDLVILA